MVSDGSGGQVQGLCGVTEPPHVDPRFASDRDWFRLEWMGELVFVGIVEKESHLAPD